MKYVWLMFALIVCSGLSTEAVVIETIPVGNPGNLDDTDDEGYGGVDYLYRIGTYEVTASQYTEFLNAVAATDTYGLYSTSMAGPPSGCRIERAGSTGGYTYSVAAEWANRPVNFVSFWDASRFANWMHNGQPTGPQDATTTEDGAYTLSGYMGSQGQWITRNSWARWFVPNEDEWYKAAYHMNDGATGNYWNYPTGTNTRPSNDLIDPDPCNNANFNDAGLTIDAPYYRTEIGEFENSASPYGTYDQGGNVWEWNESIGLVSHRGRRGGGYSETYSYLQAASHSYIDPGADASCVGGLGFRVGCVPEPICLVLMAAGGTILLSRRKSGGMRYGICRPDVSARRMAAATEPG